MPKVASVIFKAVAFACALSSGSQLRADAYSCAGVVAQLTVPPNGIVNVSFSFPPSSGMSYQDLCSVNEDWQGVKPSTCKAILAVLMTAHQAQRPITMYFNTATPGVCSKPAWSSIHQYGWYWGPVLSNQ